MKNIYLLLLFPLALQAQQFQVYPGEYDNWVRHPKSKRVFNIVSSSTEPVADLPAIADGEGKGSASLHTAGFIGVDGFAYVWGDNVCNISGRGLKAASIGATKTAVSNARQIVAYANSGDGSGPGMGYGFAIVTNDNKLTLLGNTQSGFRGDGTEGNRAEPAPYVVTAIKKPIRKVAVGSFVYVLYMDGTVDSWGGTRLKYYPTYVLGRGVDNPDPTRPGVMKFPEPIVDLDGGGAWTYFRGKSGAIYGVAYNTRYLGLGPDVSGRNIPFNLTKTLRLPGNPAQLAVGTQASYALMSNGDVYAWGDNTQAAIGNGQEAKFENFVAPWGGGSLWVDKPLKINPAGVSFVKLFTSIGDAFYVVAEDKSGQLWVWGRNKGHVLWNGRGSADPTIQASQPNKWDVLAPMKIAGFSQAQGQAQGQAQNRSQDKLQNESRGQSQTQSPASAQDQRVSQGQSQDLDTLVDVGGYKLHFIITRGDGLPILFEAGGGEDATTWNKIIRPIAQRTATTIITYDRAGFGKSTFDTTRHGIQNGITGLETGLKKLGYDGNIILVAHSQGGLYAQLYSSRHPDKVVAAVLLDVTTTCFYDEQRLAATQQLINRQNTNALKATKPGTYYQGADFSANIEWMRKFAFPNTIPVTDFVSDHPPFTDSADINDWKRCHREFAAASANRTGILATGCGHFIFNDDPSLVINAIVKTYYNAFHEIK
ncbi:alpha/beta fold hydrolase [Puia sp.]|jgi:pimeloyl-ACP methyl ester carboxylesterase|uniref:alpha/beta fold hydrolase n=1 Tax=Puia sp. TaxID=2045100 RepID=UPI002F415C1E